jgi:hypothetical protein
MKLNFITLLLLSMAVCKNSHSQSTHLDYSVSSISFSQQYVEEGIYYASVSLSSKDGKVANIGITPGLSLTTIPQQSSSCATPNYIPFSFTKSGGNSQGNVTSQTSVQISISFDPKEYQYQSGSLCELDTADGTGNYSSRLTINYSGSQQGSPSGVSGTIIIPISGSAIKRAIVNSISNLSTHENSIHIYPNPTKDKIAVSFPQDEAIELYNLLGERIFSDNGKKEYIIDLQHVETGIYLIKTESGIIKRIIKQ